MAFRHLSPCYSVATACDRPRRGRQSDTSRNAVHECCVCRCNDECQPLRDAAAQTPVRTNAVSESLLTSCCSALSIRQFA